MFCPCNPIPYGWYGPVRPFGVSSHDSSQALGGCSLSSIIKRLLRLKIRRRRRRRAGKGLYVVVNRTAGRYQIDDIGMGGLSFHYVDSGLQPSSGSYDLRIVSDNQHLAVEVEGKIVAENETGELVFQRKRIKRRSIRFERVNRQQRIDLKALLDRCAKK